MDFKPAKRFPKVPLGAIWIVIALGGWWLYGAAPSSSMSSAGQARLIQADSSRPFPPLPEASLLGLNPDRVALGRRLFHDPRLSSDGTLACASCHDLSKGGADNRPFSPGKNGQPGRVNSPSVYNSGFNFAQFWDGRAATLEEQVDGPVGNPAEFATTWPAILARLGADKDLLAAFKTAYPEGLTAGNARHAIAEFERSLITPSRFDRFLNGDAQALGDAEKRGLGLFQSYGCGGCHQGRNVGGNVYQRLGVVKDYFQGRTITEADRGRYNVTRDPKDMHVFKVPSLRNVALTAPYFHDGSAATLSDAVAVMARHQLGVELPPDDKEALVAFLKSLTGEGL